MSDPDDGLARPVHLLFVCTANRVRSPFAAAVARRRLAQLGLPAVVESAGSLAAGLPAIEDMIDVAKRHGEDLAPHRSSRLSEPLVDQADLIVTMTGQHVVDLVGAMPQSRSRAFTLKEWARATDDGRALPDWTPEGARAWAAQLTDRPLDVLLSGAVDIDDPIGRPRRFYRRTAEEIDSLLSVVF